MTKNFERAIFSISENSSCFLKIKSNKIMIYSFHRVQIGQNELTLYLTLKILNPKELGARV